MAPGHFVLWMLPWIAIAAAILYAGYAAYKTRETRERIAHAPAPGPDPLDELERINTEMSRLAAQSRQTLESARDAMQRGLRG